MTRRIERRRLRAGRWLMYPLIALSATALAGLAIASRPGPAGTVYRVIQLSGSAFSGPVNARGQGATRGTTRGASGGALAAGDADTRSAGARVVDGAVRTDRR